MLIKEKSSKKHGKGDHEASITPVAGGDESPRKEGDGTIKYGAAVDD
ncbi:MAG: hypothetical protein ACMG6E_05695 [Candidatus Roizmanbacteria bacterium]